MDCLVVFVRHCLRGTRLLEHVDILNVSFWVCTLLISVLGNPDLPTTACPDLEVCARTPFGRYRCICAENYRRDVKSGKCCKLYG